MMVPDIGRCVLVGGLFAGILLSSCSRRIAVGCFVLHMSFFLFCILAYCFAFVAVAGDDSLCIQEREFHLWYVDRRLQVFFHVDRPLRVFCYVMASLINTA